jgi:hypothetical protein
VLLGLSAAHASAGDAPGVEPLFSPGAPPEEKVDSGDDTLMNGMKLGCCTLR